MRVASVHMPSAQQAQPGGSPSTCAPCSCSAAPCGPRGLLAAIHRSILDLPVTATRNLRDLWLDSAAALARGWQLDHLRVRVLLAPGAYEPRSLASSGPVRFSVERDRGQFLGTGGVVRDACERYPDDTYVLVANAGQVMIEPLEQIASDLAAADADIVVITHEDGTPSGLTLLRCACLRILPDVGTSILKSRRCRLSARHIASRCCAGQAPPPYPSAHWATTSAPCNPITAAPPALRPAMTPSPRIGIPASASWKMAPPYTRPPGYTTRSSFSAESSRKGLLSYARSCAPAVSCGAIHR